MNGYQINEDDIRIVIRYLELHKPLMANREYAIQVLEIMQGAARRIASDDIGFAEDLEKLLAELNTPRTE